MKLNTRCVVRAHQVSAAHLRNAPGVNPDGVTELDIFCESSFSSRYANPIPMFAIFSFSQQKPPGNIEHPIASLPRTSASIHALEQVQKDLKELKEKLSKEDEKKKSFLPPSIEAPKLDAKGGVSSVELVNVLR